jgi:hypothetical protein
MFKNYILNPYDYTFKSRNLILAVTNLQIQTPHFRIRRTRAVQRRDNNDIWESDDVTSNRRLQNGISFCFHII